MLKYGFVLTAATILLTLVAAPTKAGERYHGGRHHHHGRGEAVIGSNGLPSVVPGIGTFVGSISALRIKGNGVFLAIERNPQPHVIAYRAPKAKIIEISAENPEESCAFEAGVCVIRPQN
jgi:hypothetical protein